MSTSALTTVDEYLNLDVKPYCEYVDGVLYPKSVPSFNHSLFQGLLIMLLAAHSQRYYVLPELRVRIRPGKYLVPDLAVVEREMMERPYPTKPVFLCIEIASPEDRPGQLLAKCEDYHQWGVPHCWIVDPERRIAWIYDRETDWVKLNEAGTLVAGEIEIPLAELFSQLPK